LTGRRRRGPYYQLPTTNWQLATIPLPVHPPLPRIRCCPDMNRATHSSLRRYRLYRQQIKQRPGDAQPAQQDDQQAITGQAVRLGQGRSKARNRPVGVLLRAFWELIEGQRLRLGLALLGLTLSTLLSLAPLAAPKPVFDTVIGDRPLPAQVTDIWPALAE